MSWVSRFIYANLNYLLGGLVLLMVFICGVQIGEARVQREWNAEKLRAALVAAKQEQRAADVQQSQSQINQEISNEYAKNAKALGSRLPGLRPVGVCISAPISAGSVPTVSEAPAGAASLSVTGELARSRASNVNLAITRLHSEPTALVRMPRGKPVGRPLQRLGGRTWPSGTHDGSGYARLRLPSQ